MSQPGSSAGAERGPATAAKSNKIQWLTSCAHMARLICELNADTKTAATLINDAPEEAHRVLAHVMRK